MGEQNRVKLEVFENYFGDIIAHLNSKEGVYWSKRNIENSVPSKTQGSCDNYVYYFNKMVECAVNRMSDVFYIRAGSTYTQVLRKETNEFYQEAAFVKAYINSLLKIQSKEWEIPECVYKMYFDKSDAWKELPHRSITEADKLAFYRTEDDYIRDRATKTKPARYFMSKSWGKESEALEFNNSWVSTGTKLPKLFLLSEREGGCSEENWKWAYGNTDTDTNSCMIKCSDAARVYAYDKTLDLAYFTEDDSPNGLIITRTILRTDINKYIRIYYTDYRQEKLMDIILKGKGYECERDMDGVKLGLVPRNESSKNSFWMPYVDGNSQYVIKKDDYFLVVNYDDIDDDSEDYYEADDAQGYLFVKSKCRCGKMTRDFSQLVVIENDKKKVLEVCGRCADNAIWDEDTEMYYSQKDFVYYLVFEEYDSVRHIVRRSDTGQYTLPDNVVKLTDQHLISHFSLNDKDCIGAYTKKADSVTLYNGSIGSRFRTWKPRLDQKGINIIGQDVWDNFYMSSAEFRLRDKFSKCYWDGDVKHRNNVISVMADLGLVNKNVVDEEIYANSNFSYADLQVNRTSDDGIVNYQILTPEPVSGVEAYIERNRNGWSLSDAALNVLRQDRVVAAREMVYYYNPVIVRDTDS